MKKRTRFISLFLVGISTFLFACSSKDNKPSATSKPSQPKNEYVDYKLDHGIHEYKVAPTGKKIVENGKTDYVVVYPENISRYDELAVKELRLFFEEATGIILKAKSDKGLTYSENNKYICIGNVSFESTVEADGEVDLKDIGMELTSDLGLSGFKLQTVGNSVYMASLRYGALSAVYEFLARCFHYEYYAADCYTIDRSVTDLELKDFKIKDVPDIMTSAVLSTLVQNGPKEHQWRLRLTPDAVIQSNHHNAYEYIGPDMVDENDKLFSEAHPEFFATDGNQLCYTARGNAESLELMRDIVYKKIIKLLESRSVNFWVYAT